MEEKLTALKIREFIDLTASDAPAPGGGSAAALCGAVGTGLGLMTASLTVGKKKYASVEEELRCVLTEGKPLLDELTNGIDRDTEAFNVVMAALSLPKLSDEEKALRRSAIEDATKEATLVPLGLMERCEEATALLERLQGKINPNCASDLGSGAVLVKAALQCAWLNVRINVGGLRDEAFAADCTRRGQALLDALLPRLDALYAAVLGEL